MRGRFARLKQALRAAENQDWVSAWPILVFGIILIAEFAILIRPA